MRWTEVKNGRFQYYKKCDGGGHEGIDERKETFQDQHCRYLRYLADQIMGGGKEEAFLMAIIRWVMDENIMLPGEFVKQLDATISLGAQKIIEVKQKKGVALQ